MRPELFWDCDMDHLSPDTIIERAINSGGFDFIEEVQNTWSMARFIQVLKQSRNLNKKAVNYWCMVLGIDPAETRAFQTLPSPWIPFR